MKKLLLTAALLTATPAHAADVAVGNRVIENDDIVFVCVRATRENDPYVPEICFDPYNPGDRVSIQACGIFYLDPEGQNFPYTDCTNWYPVDRVVIE